MSLEKKLAAEFRKKLRNELLVRFILKSWIGITERFRWMRFGPTFLIISLLLIILVAGTLVLKVSTNTDFPLVSFRNPTQLAYMGQIGDFFGGVLNPLLSFMALIAVLFTIKIQSQELKEAKEETRIANRIQDKQTAVFERQNFESVLFRLLDVHSRLADQIRNWRKLGEHDKFESAARRIIELINTKVSDDEQYGNLGWRTSNRETMNWEQELTHDRNLYGSAATRVLAEENKLMFSQYFRNIYQILKLIDNFKLDTSEDHQDKNKRYKRQIRLEYFHRRQYSNILRAQLSDDELKVLFFNCLTSNGEGLKFYVEKYSMLKHLAMKEFLGDSWTWRRLYDEVAFADYERISDYQIRDYQKAKSQADFSRVFPHR